MEKKMLCSAFRILPCYVASIYEGRNGDIQVLDKKTKQPIGGCIQFADSKMGYYVELVRCSKTGDTYHILHNREILIKRFDRNNETWLDCFQPSLGVL